MCKEPIDRVSRATANKTIFKDGLIDRRTFSLSSTLAPKAKPFLDNEKEGTPINQLRSEEEGSPCC